MRRDVLDLRAFYASPLGRAAREMLGRKVEEAWGDARGLDVLGLGYATPFLDKTRPQARRVVAAMPAAQGVEVWPSGGANAATLVEETALPFPNAMFDRILAVHALEEADDPGAVLREIWRVMADGGRLIVVAPTRAGLWSQIDRSPFYQGHPYSPGQLAALLRANMFAPLQQTRALFMPPTRSRLMMRMAPAVERFGQRWLGRFAGVSVIESGKQLYAGVAERSQSPALVAARPKLRIASSRDTHAARNAGDGEAPAS